MDTANTFYVADKGKAPAAIAAVDAAQISKWAAETEVQPGRGVARAGGQWRVRLALSETPAATLAMVDAAHALGFPATVRPFRTAEITRYEVSIRHLPSAAEAQAVATRLAAELKLTEVKISR
jgi:hypothetical protein